MTAGKLTAAITGYLPPELAKKIIAEFLTLRRDALTSTLGRNSAGKFVEAFVQALQHLERGSYDHKPAADKYLRDVESRPGLPESLRICAARVGRAIYTLRNKRNIAHLGSVDPNVFDLRFTYAAAQWVVAELIRLGSGVPMAEAGLIVAEVQQPLHLLVERSAGERVVHAKVTVREELLILLHSAYPDSLTLDEIYGALKRRKRDTVRRSLVALWESKAILGDRVAGPLTLSHAGFEEAVTLINAVADRTSH